jgi:hypothetical protein
MTMVRIPSRPPSKMPVHVLPRGEKARRELYGAGFIGSWRGYLFWLSVFLAFVAMLFFLD